jgi:ankyrin repeat protein
MKKSFSSLLKFKDLLKMSAKEMKTDLQEAIKCGDTERVFRLLESKCDPNTDFGRDNALTHAVHVTTHYPYVDTCDSISIINLLVAYKADVNRLDSYGTTPLNWSVTDDRLVRALLCHHPKIDARSNMQRTALHSAIAYNKFSVVVLLIDAGADTNVLTEERNTPLHMASNLSIVEYLVAHGAATSLFVRNTAWQTPAACNRLCRSLVEKFGRPPYRL